MVSDGSGWRYGEVGIPTFAVVSVRLLSVVLLPDEGLPTRPMRGSRGIMVVAVLQYCSSYACREVRCDEGLICL